MTFRKELVLSLAWVLLYLVVFVKLASVLSGLIGVPHFFNAVAELLFPAIAVAYLHKRNLLSYYGFTTLRALDYRRLLYLVPMAAPLAVTASLDPADDGCPWQQALLLMAWMTGVGFSEGVLLRGFVLRALIRRGAGMAVGVSSLAFGLLHLVNLIGGADLVATLLQVAYATCMGLMLSTFVCRTNNIIPCVLPHSALDVAGVFVAEPSVRQSCALCVIYSMVCACYAWYLHATDRPLVKRGEE